VRAIGGAAPGKWMNSGVEKRQPQVLYGIRQQSSQNGFGFGRVIRKICNPSENLIKQCSSKLMDR
jgi:hypothetical protein